MEIKDVVIKSGQYKNKSIGTTLIVKGSVDKIEDKAFEGCDLYFVNIEEGEVPIRIAKNAFDKCKNLLEISCKREAIFYNKINYRRKYL